MALLLALVCLPLVAGCDGSSSGEGRTRTIDVPPGLEVDTSNDPQARERPPELTGILPGDFPADLPIYLPASLIDFGRSEQGRRSVTLLTPHRPSRVRRQLETLLVDRGWTGTVETGRDGEVRFTLRKETRQAWLHVADARPGTVYRFEY